MTASVDIIALRQILHDALLEGRTAEAKAIEQEIEDAWTDYSAATCRFCRKMGKSIRPIGGRRLVMGHTSPQSVLLCPGSWRSPVELTNSLRWQQIEAVRGSAASELIRLGPDRWSDYHEELVDLAVEDYRCWFPNAKVDSWWFRWTDARFWYVGCTFCRETIGRDVNEPLAMRPTAHVVRCALSMLARRQAPKPPGEIPGEIKQEITDD